MQPNPYDPSTTQAVSTLVEKRSRLWVVVLGNIVLCVVAFAVWGLRMQQDDPDVGFLSDASTVLWLITLATTVVVNCWIVIELFREKWVGLIPLVWLIVSGVYLGWFVISFLRFVGGV